MSMQLPCANLPLSAGASFVTVREASVTNPAHVANVHMAPPSMVASVFLPIRSATVVMKQAT